MHDAKENREKKMAARGGEKHVCCDELSERGTTRSVVVFGLLKMSF